MKETEGIEKNGEKWNEEKWDTEIQQVTNMDRCGCRGGREGR